MEDKMNLGDVQAQQSEEQNSYAPIPDGIYPVKVMEVTPGKKSKSSDMVYTEVTLVIDDGEFGGRRIWERFPEKNTSTKALSVGRQRLEKFLKASMGEEKASAVLNGEQELAIAKNAALSVKLKTSGKFTNVKAFMA